MTKPPIPPHLRVQPDITVGVAPSNIIQAPPSPTLPRKQVNLVDAEKEASSANAPAAREPQTHDQLLETIIKETLRPEHGTDPNILRFIANYNLCHDVKQAARDSGLSVHDGKRLIQRPDIYECTQRIAAAGARKFGYDAEEVVAKVKEVIEFDPVDLVDPETGAFYEDISKIPPETRRVIKKLNVINIYEKDPNGVIIGVSSKVLKFEFWDKLKAAEMLGGEKDVFKRQVKVEHEVGSNMRETLLGRLEDAESRKVLKAKDVTNET